MQYTNKIHETNKLIRKITKCFKMLVNRPFNRINTIILWNIIKPTKSLQFIGMWKQFVAGRHSNVVTNRQFRNELQFMEMMDMDEIHTTTIKLNHFTDSHLFIFEDFLKTLFQYTLRISSVLLFKSNDSHAYLRIGNVYVSNRFSFKISLTFLVCDIIELTAA